MALEPRDRVEAVGEAPTVPDGRPAVDARPRAPTRHLSPRVRTLWRLGGLAACAGLAAATALLAAAVDGDARVAVVAASAVALGAALTAGLVVPGLRWDRWTYCLGPDAIELRHGVLVRRRSTVPYFRVQHIDLVTGPLDRLFGLTTLHLRTASATTSATIPGLEEHEAEALRTTVLHRAGRGDAV